MDNNGIFQLDDPSVSEVAGVKLDPQWWSRPHEYAFAMAQVNQNDLVVADMGCGWMPRPLKDYLALHCETVYAVDADPRLDSQPRAENMRFVIADITQPIPQIPAASLDMIFCISVLEDLGSLAAGALLEFARLIKPTGRIVLTFDTPWDINKPTPKYPGLPLHKFVAAKDAAGLTYLGNVPNMDYRQNALLHGPWNLCVAHYVLIKL